MTKQPLSLQDMNAWIDAQRPRWMEDFFQFLSFPSISADPQNKQDILQLRRLAGSLFKRNEF